MKEKIKNVFRVIIFGMICFVTYLIIQSTFSKYITLEKPKLNTNISKWSIKVNNQDITDNADFSDTLVLNLDSNNNVAPNLIAPNIKGTVDVELDSTGTDLPFKYSLKVGDGDITDSIYTTNIQNSWDDHDGTITFDLVFSFETYDYPGPINSYTNAGVQTYGETFEVRFKMSKGFQMSQEDLNRIWISKKSYVENGELVLNIFWWAWTWDSVRQCNYFNQNVHLKYVEGYDPTLPGNTFTEGILFNGKHLVDAVIPDFKIYAYSLNDGEKINLEPNQTTIEGIVQPKDDPTEKVINNLKLYVYWYDEEDNFFNNAQDVAVSQIVDALGSLSLDLKVQQLLPGSI